ncbi:hypothetical protein [Jeotgalibaca arthritidis]|uniref:hypothetical protein n=1 Tax=Jeotgalibaca arthritidis TaxID=1868794 RepID=UPI00359F9ED7
MILIDKKSGHAVGTVLSSDKHVHIYLGSRGKENKENFHIGRLHFHIQYAFSGFCKWGTGLNRRQRFISLIGGPLLSFIMMVAAALMLEFVPTGVGKTLLAGFAEVNLFLFVGTLTPFQLPQWFGEQFSFPSDGLQLLRLLREKKFRKILKSTQKRTSDSLRDCYPEFVFCNCFFLLLKSKS